MKKVMLFLVGLLFSVNAFAGLVVIGNSGSGVDALSKGDVKKLFLGKKTNLGSGSVQIIELTDGSAQRLEFHSMATGRSEAQLQSAWTRLVFTGKAEAPVQVADYAAVITEVAGNPNAIGYVDESSLSDSVKVLYRF